MKEGEAQADSDHKLVVYVEREDGSYGPLTTGSFMVGEHLDDYLEKRKRWQAEAFDKLRRGIISPVAYYHSLSNISEPDLARRVGIRTGKVRKHRIPEYFARMSVAMLARYADVFGIPVSEMLEIPEPGERGDPVIPEKTANPLVTIRKTKKADDE